MNSGLSIADAYVEASATASLSERDILKAHLARRTLIEAFSDEAVGGEQLPPRPMPGS